MRWNSIKKKLSDVNVAFGVDWQDMCIQVHISKQNFQINHAFYPRWGPDDAGAVAD